MTERRGGDERRADVIREVAILSVEVAALKQEVANIKTAIEGWTTALANYREVHITCPFNPERNGAAVSLIEAVKNLQEDAIKYKAYLRGLLYGITGLGALQAWDILGPILSRLIK